MTSLERVRAVLAGGQPDRVPFVPIVHSGLAGMFGVPLGRFFTDARTMADVIIEGFHTFGYDGVQLSLGVTAEPEAFGAGVIQPEDAAPALKDHVLKDVSCLEHLRNIDPVNHGRFPLFREAVERVVKAVGNQAFVIVTLRGPFLMAAQLHGVENVLISTVASPEMLHGLLDFTAETSIRLGRAFADTGAHAVVLGEATCSPSFISPDTYRDLTFHHHQHIVADLKRSGWETVGLHICGDIMPILEDMIATGSDLIDVDHQVAADAALRVNAARAALRGNLDPSTVFAFGTPGTLVAETAKLKDKAGNRGCWIYGSGCDISPGSPATNLGRVAELLRQR